jgi:hypothetical protein
MAEFVNDWIHEQGERDGEEEAQIQGQHGSKGGDAADPAHGMSEHLQPSSTLNWFHELR